MASEDLSTGEDAVSSAAERQPLPKQQQARLSEAQGQPTWRRRFCCTPGSCEKQRQPRRTVFAQRRPPVESRQSCSNNCDRHGRREEAQLQQFYAGGKGRRQGGLRRDG
ncbi:hypothetical protein cyc_09044 [Cyclospora cayetanensis]|uniref:Uncharacterized protein n=1 Tax=Cyclospora cayetanensis TaxID=88456 RepID=A0A1D3CSG1_9EIME|nr:hypothetical protein cyc_09044 [Cyclospora cayetanensis]